MQFGDNYHFFVSDMIRDFKSYFLRHKTCNFLKIFCCQKLVQMSCNFAKVDDSDKDLSCKTVMVFDHLRHRENKKYRYLEAKGKIHLVKDLIMSSW